MIMLTTSGKSWQIESISALGYEEHERHNVWIPGRVAAQVGMQILASRHWGWTQDALKAYGRWN